MGSWKLFFEEPLALFDIWLSTSVLALHIVLFLMVTTYHFNRKDILS